MKTNPLKNISIASPCSANWEEMFGNERQRYCGECKMNVYNLSGMTKDEAENLILQTEGRLCVRFYRRNDGTVLTKDCPVGWAKVKRNISRMATAVFSLFAGVFGGLLTFNLLQPEKTAVKMGKISSRNYNVATMGEYPIENNQNVTMGTIVANPKEQNNRETNKKIYQIEKKKSDY